MNIFYLHRILTKCAKFYVDKHVVKMPLETAQLLCSVHYFFKHKSYTSPYKLTHKNHPCAIWVRSSLENYMWLCELGIEICKEYTFRYGKVHKCEAIIRDLQSNPPEMPSIEFTNPPQCMPDAYKSKSVVRAYRKYVANDKKHIHAWKNRPVPKFIAKYVEPSPETPVVVIDLTQT